MAACISEPAVLRAAVLGNVASELADREGSELDLLLRRQLLIQLSYGQSNCKALYLP